MNDLISRQAAIDEIDEWIKAFRENGHKESAADACLIQDGIIQMPSVQPEIIHCSNCRFFKRNIPCTGGRYNGCEMWLDDGNEIRVMTDDYCSKALPKER